MLASCFIVLASFLFQSGTDSFRTELESWQRKREASISSETGWLTVVGLFWLRDGENTVGTKPGSAIRLPASSAPETTGVFRLSGGVVTFEATRGVSVLIDGKTASRGLMRPDTAGRPTEVRIHDLTMTVIERGGRLAIRLRDRNSAARRSFRGLKFFPANERYRLNARFVPYDPPKKVSVPNVLGGLDEEPSPGYAVFNLDDREYRLDALVSGDSLFFIFRDRTAGHDTYPAGRFLYTPKPVNGELVLDFNHAFNPPCAYTPYATCPLPPRQNHLDVRIEAGELNYGH